MAWFSNEAEFFAPLDDTLSQGDLVLAPTTLLQPGEGQAPGVAPNTLGEEQTIKLWNSATNALPEAPAVAARTLWDLAMILPHECALEKEFNERVSGLLRSGVSQEEAERTASADSKLDRWIAIAPVRSYAELPVERYEGVRSNQRLGTFPIPANATLGTDAGWVDFNRITTIDRALLTPNVHLAKLSVTAIAYLRAALAKHWAYRDLTRYDELSKAIGRKVLDIHAISLPKNRLRVDIILDGESGSLTLEGSAALAPPEYTKLRHR